MRITRANPGKSVDYLADVNDLVADATTTAPGVGLAAAAKGQRYILVSGTSSLHANWGTISGVGNNDIVECFEGPGGTLYWDVDWDASAAGAGGIVWDLNTTMWYEWNGVAWHSLPALKYYKGTTTYAGSVPSASEMNAFLPAQDDFGHFRKGDTDSVFFVHRHSLAGGGTIADFSWTEMVPNPSRAITTIETEFTFSTASPVTITTGLKAGDLLVGSKIMITTAFDDAAATLSMGTTNLGATVLHDTIHNNPQVAGTYQTDDIVAVTMADNATLTITPGASTSGAGTAVIYVKRA